MVAEYQGYSLQEIMDLIVLMTSCFGGLLQLSVNHPLHAHKNGCIIILDYAWEMESVIMRWMSKALDVQEFYPAEMDVAVVEQTSDEVCLKIYVRSNSCNCPKCGQESTHQHSTYVRRIQDLPIFGKRTYLLVNAY